MTGPYRTAGTLDAGEAEAPKTELGELRSTHPRGGGYLPLGKPPVEVYQNGLVLGDAANRAVVLFEEIDAVYYDCEGIVLRPHRVALVTFDGVRSTIPDDIRDLERVLETINREVTRPITARAKEALVRGERLVFGPLVLELDGIVLKGERLAWADLVQVVAERDSLVFHATYDRRFGWARLADIPHPLALLAVLGLRTEIVMRGLRLDGG